MKVTTRLIVCCLFALLTACDYRAKKLMVCAVSQQWQCPVEAITVQSLGAATYRLTGCSHDETYYCKTPGEGCMTAAPNRNILDTSACRTR